MNITEKEVMIKGEVSIGATITCGDESKKNPAVVIIMGTGKTDRDGNSKGFQTDLYKNLAQMYAELGFVVVRYDKRGTFKTEIDDDNSMTTAKNQYLRLSKQPIHAGTKDKICEWMNKM